MKKNNMQDIVITGNWDGQPIWRPKTSTERLSEALERQMQRRHIELEQEKVDKIEALLKEKQPLNYAWNKLEEVHGFDGDRTGIDVAGREFDNKSR